MQQNHAPPNLLSYVRLVSQLAFEDFKWGRDLTLSTAIAVLTAAIQFDAGMPANIAERRIMLCGIVGPYVVVFGAHVSWRLLDALHRVHGPEVMLSFDWNESSGEHQGIGVHNIAGGTAYKIKVQIGSGESCVDFGVIPHLEEGSQTEAALQAATVTKIAALLRIYSAKTNAARVSVPAIVSFQNAIGTIFEQDFDLIFDKDKGRTEVASILKRGERRILKSPELSQTWQNI